MVKTLTILLIMATLGVAIVFAVLNFDAVPFHFLLGETRASLSILLFGAFLAGLGFGLILDGWVMLQQRNRIRRLERQVRICQSELSNLRKLPLKDFDT